MRKESESENRVQLTMAKQQGTLIEVHNLPNDDYFNVGFVVAFDPVFCLMISIDWDGKINGLIAIRIKSILYTERHSDYLMTVSEKTKVAHDSYENRLPVVIGTEKYKGSDDFTGIITDLTPIKVTIHYYNDHDLSSLWEYDILRAKIDYLRVRGTQMATGKQIFNDIFNEM